MHKQKWADFGYELILTKDGSPSLAPICFGATKEMMHHQAGAWNETQYIYGRLLQPTFQNCQNPNFLSLGLGLGYNEICIAEQGLLAQKKWCCDSYEKNPELCMLFSQYVRDELAPSEIFETYQLIFSRLKNADLVKASLRSALVSGQLRLNGELNHSTKFANRFHAFLWDAYSQKTSNELWEAEFLKKVLFESMSKSEWCGFSTYACTGSLKRTLREVGFTVSITPGFSGKRESTFAHLNF